MKHKIKHWPTILVAIGAKFQIISLIGVVKMMLKYPSYFLLNLGIGILWVVVAINLRKSAILMEENLRKGSFRALIFSLIGLNILSLIGAVAGIMKSQKNSKKKTLVLLISIIGIIILICSAMIIIDAVSSEVKGKEQIKYLNLCYSACSNKNITNSEELSWCKERCYQFYNLYGKEEADIYIQKLIIEKK